MGKSKTDELPTLNPKVKYVEEVTRRLEPHEFVTGGVPPEAEPTPKQAEVEGWDAPEVEPLRLVTLEVPLGMVDPRGYVPIRERLEAKSMSRAQSIGLLRMLRGLQDRGDCLNDGTPIKRGAQAVRWMLEQLASGS